MVLNVFAGGRARLGSDRDLRNRFAYGGSERTEDRHQNGVRRDARRHRKTRCWCWRKARSHRIHDWGFKEPRICRLVAGLLFQVDAMDPITYVTIVGILFATVLEACWIPARRPANIGSGRGDSLRLVLSVSARRRATPAADNQAIWIHQEWRSIPSPNPSLLRVLTPGAGASRKSSIFLGRIVGVVFMRVNSKCAHQVRPPPDRTGREEGG